MSPTATLSLHELAPGTATKVSVGGIPVAVVRIDDDVYAIGDVCSHGNFSLSEGEVWCEERELECPKHGSTFSLETGEPTTLPATQAVPVFDAADDAPATAVEVEVVPVTTLPSVQVDENIVGVVPDAAVVCD